MAPTRWGIASSGKICHDFTNALSMLLPENHKVVAVAARALSSAEEFAKVFNIPKAYGSYQELANDPEIDVVYVGTIHPFHFDVSKMMVDAGKSVLCEKPVTMNLKQTKAILEVAKERNVFFMEGFWSRFFPTYNKLREILARGDFGEVKFVKASFGFPLFEVERLKNKSLGGGGLMDIGCYPVQLALLVFKELPSKIVASGIVTNGVDEAGCVTLHFSGNRMAQLNYHAGVELDQKALIYGTNGIIEVPNFWNPETLVTPDKKYEHPLPKSTRPMNYLRSEGFTYEAEAVRESLLKGEKENPLMTHEDSIKIMTVMDEIRRQMGVVYDADNE